MPKITNREKVLVALLETPSVRDAAKSSGVSEATIYNFLRDSEFKTAYREARRQTVETAIAQMQSAASEAVDRLKELQYCENPAVAARCAQIIFENSIKGMETLDILERLEILEDEHKKQIEENGKPNNQRRF
jgi:DeoR/GlpR family transcriptional regulator of sugar metabolism